MHSGLQARCHYWFIIQSNSLIYMSDSPSPHFHEMCSHLIVFGHPDKWISLVEIKMTCSILGL